MNRTRKRWYSILLSLLMLVTTFLQGWSAPVYAEGEAKAVDITITNMKILNAAREERDTIFYTESFFLAMDWDASANGPTIKAGDYFDVTLPDNMVFPSDSASCDFPLLAPDGVTPMAQAHVTPNPAGGGTVHVVFNDWVQDQYNVRGNMELSAKFDRTEITQDQVNTFNVTVNGQVIPLQVTPQGPGVLSDEWLSKWGGRVEADPNQAQWGGRINHIGAPLTNVVITDTLEGTGQSFLPDTFKVQKVKYDDRGRIIETYGFLDLAGILIFGPGNTTYTLNLGNLTGDQQFNFSYRSTYTPGQTLKNKITLSSTEKVEVKVATHKSMTSGGSGAGDLASKIKLIKVDAENETTVLAGAVFEVTKPNGDTFDLTTGADGTVVSGVLEQGSYKVREKVAPAGYLLNDEEFILEVTPAGGAIQTVKDTPEPTRVSVTKTWSGPVRDSVTVKLMDGDTEVAEAILNAGNNWSHTFEDLRKYRDGDLIQYTVKEDPVPDGYEESLEGDMDSGFILKNTNTETVDIPVNKQWIGPKASVAVVHLYADDVDTNQSAELKEDNGWAHTFTGLAKYAADGHQIVYTVKEDALAGYSSAISGDAAGGFTVTNTNTEKIQIPVTKTWVGRPAESVTIKLKADGADKDSVVLKADNNWTHTFTDLPKYAADGHEIVYTAEEEEVAGYTSGMSGDAEHGFTFTNTIEGKVSVPVTKKWVGQGAASAVVDLLADGVKVDSATLSADNNWQHTFTDLDQYKDGNEIVYRVKERAMENYESQTEGNARDGFTITNTNTEKVQIPVTKTWVGDPAESVTVRLMADGAEKDSVVLKADNAWTHTFTDLPKFDAGDGHLIVYTAEEDAVAGYTSGMSGDAEHGFTFTNTIEGKVSVPVTKKWVGKAADSVVVDLLADGVQVDSVTLNEANNWQHTFTDLDQYKDGNEIVYTVKEQAIEGYESRTEGNAGDGFTITNTNTDKVQIPVTKQWVGEPAESVTVRLLADGVEKDSVVLKADNAWMHTFADLPKFDAGDGHEIVYTVSEDAVEGYTSGMTGDAENGFTFTNTIEGKVSVPVTKKWIGKAASSVVIDLLADGDKVASAVLTPDNNWQHTFTDLDQYKMGREIVYTVKEQAMEGYSSRTEGNARDGFLVVNTNTEKIEIPVIKKWVGKPLDSVTIRLLADGVEKQGVILKADKDWKHTFKDLPKYDAGDGHEIVYTVEENAVEGYTSGMSGDAEHGFTFTNTIAGKVSVPVTKKWIGKAGEAAVIDLLADGEKVDSVTLNKDNNWQHTFTDLEQYKDGNEILYTVKEEALEGYEAKVEGSAADGFVITNTNTETLEIPVTKKWIGKPADSITIKLIADTAEKETVVVNKDKDWKHTFKDLPKYDPADGHEIEYAVVEEYVKGYTTAISGDPKHGYTITNSFVGKVSVPVTKKWEGVEADKITVYLLADGKEIQSRDITKADKWQYTFTDLDQYRDDGTEIVYTVQEKKMSGYITTISGNAKEGYVIINKKDIPPKPRTPIRSSLIPRTGDNSQMLFYGVLLAVGLISLIVLVVYRKRHRS